MLATGEKFTIGRWDVWTGGEARGCRRGTLDDGRWDGGEARRLSPRDGGRWTGDEMGKRKTFDPGEMPRVRQNTRPLDNNCREMQIGDKHVSLFLLGNAPRPVIWVHMPAPAAAETAALLAGEDLVLADVDGVDWERELSPWPADHAFKGGRDFSGGADDYLGTLLGSIIPGAESALGETPLWRGIAGYSLAGLFAVYAAWRTTAFSAFASVSGSLWFDGFVPYLAQNEPAALPRAAFFSLGTLEKNTRSTRLAAVEDRTAEAAERLRGLGTLTAFEKNEGGHFSQPEARVAAGLRWLLRNTRG